MIDPNICQEKIKILEQYKYIVDISNIVSKTDINGTITYVNDEFCRISGYSEEELIGQSHNIIRHPDMPAEFFKELWECLRSKQVWKGIIKNKAKSGKTYIVNTTIIPILDHNKEIVEYISIRHDITELVELRDKYKKLAYVDYLTGIYNRNYFNFTFAKMIKSASEERSCSLILLDVDHFKKVNDHYGHDVGDKILREISLKISDNIRKNDMFCRVGGEEFAIILQDTTLKGSVKVAEKVKEIVEQHTFIHGINLTVSIGVALYDEGDKPEVVYKKADIALYRAKNKRNTVEWYK